MGYCEGCWGFNMKSLIPRCNVAYNKRTSPCPCSKCIVKGMCSESCDDYLKFDDYVSRVKYMREG